MGLTTIGTGDGVKRKTLTRMLSEALCLRARRVSERRWSIPIPILRRTREAVAQGSTPCSVHLLSTPPITERGAISEDVPSGDEIRFVRRTREAGGRFESGKKDGEFSI